VWCMTVWMGSHLPNLTRTLPSPRRSQISAATCPNSALPYVSVGCAGAFCDSLFR
jgi:hypothetical protein